MLPQGEYTFKNLETVFLIVCKATPLTCFLGNTVTIVCSKVPGLYLQAPAISWVPFYCPVQELLLLLQRFTKLPKIILKAAAFPYLTSSDSPCLSSGDSADVTSLHRSFSDACCLQGEDR
jgi:hypothetical protein